MKKYIFILAILVISVFLVSCGTPEEICQNVYDEIVLTYPDFPPEFVDTCVTAAIAENAAPLIRYCRYESFQEFIRNSGAPGAESVDSIKDCAKYIAENK